MPSRRPISESLKLAAAATRSGLRRYPRVLLHSLRDGLRQGGSEGGEGSPAEFRAIYEIENAVSWLGHGSVMLRLGGNEALVDPVLSARIGPRIGKMTVGPSRLAPAPITTGDLEPAEAVLITHAHFDHLDRPTLAQIANNRCVAVVARGLTPLIPRGFKHVLELDWGNSIELDTFAVRAVEPAHWGARRALDRDRGFNAYLVESDAGACFAAGDSAHTHAFDSIGPVDLAVFGIGAYDPWEHAHATPEQVWEMFTAMGGTDPGSGGSTLLPIHHSTFELSDEPIDEPMRRLLTAAGDDAGRVLCATPGEVFELITRPERRGCSDTDG
jgi:L-ascorbate metabolism protein UlaG (beta-lactamase superfamily)